MEVEMKRLLALLVLILFISFTTNSQSQQWSAEQLEVWNTIEAQWKADKDGKNWIEEFVHPDCIGWNMNTPMPRDKASANRWFNASIEFSKTLEYQIAPYAIVVKGNVAIAHYYFHTLNETYEGKKVWEKGRWTDILIKEANKWQFIGWQGGEDKQN
jgi:ketosteroid isomerase-like protein